jgi:SlyX protein
MDRRAAIGFEQTRRRAMAEPTLEDRVIELETRLTFQEETISQLNEALVDLGDDLETMRRRMALMKEKLDAVDVSVLAEGEEPLPPHY